MGDSSIELENHEEFQPNLVPETPVSLMKSIQFDHPLSMVVRKFKKDNRNQDDASEDNKYIFLR